MPDLHDGQAFREGMGQVVIARDPKTARAIEVTIFAVGEQFTTTQHEIGLHRSSRAHQGAPVSKAARVGPLGRDDHYACTVDESPAASMGPGDGAAEALFGAPDFKARQSLG